MKLIYRIIIIIAIMMPARALAAYNDVTLTTSTSIQVGSYTINISGSSATIQSITVNPTNFSVTLASSSSITISSPTLNQLSSDITSDVISNICTASQSIMYISYSGTGTVTNTITPSATTCTGGAPTAPTAPPASTGNSISSAFSGGSVSNQLSNLLAMGFYTQAQQLASQYGVPITIPALSATATPAASATNIVVSTSTKPFTYTLLHGVTDPEVKQLQEFLNEQGFIIATTGGGSPGNETDYFGPATFAAVKKFQLAYKKEILTPGGLTNPTGFFGPATLKEANLRGFNKNP